MAVEVAKIEIKNVSDASGLEACIVSGQMAADDVVAVIGKTEGNGGVNDFTRILSDQAFRGVLTKLGSRSEAQIKQIPMVWSGGCDGVITPHATVFARNDKTGTAGKSRLTIGQAISAEVLPEDIGRPAMVEKVAVGVRAAMEDAGISDPKDVHYVQTKTPLLTRNVGGISASRIGADAQGYRVAVTVKPKYVAYGWTDRQESGLRRSMFLGPVAQFPASRKILHLDVELERAGNRLWASMDHGEGTVGLDKA